MSSDYVNISLQRSRPVEVLTVTFIEGLVPFFNCYVSENNRLFSIMCISDANISLTIYMNMVVVIAQGHTIIYTAIM